MRLNKLHLGNFKGIKDFTLDAKGGTVDIFGDNATGKTTIADAFCWLLFDKDSQNKKDFEIKTLDENNQPISGLDHEVEAELEVNGKVITLKKVYKEKWIKKRGSATPAFTGHTTDYYIDDVPVKKKEYEAKIAEIVDEDVFKLLTSPAYFNEQLHWQDRRKILLAICGDISDEEVISSDSALAKLPEILGDRKLEDHRKVIASRRTVINKEIERIPVRIDEVMRGLPDISGINEKDVVKLIKSLKEVIKEKEQQIARIENGGEIAEQTKTLREIEGQLLDIKNKYHSRNEAVVMEKQEQYFLIRTKISGLTSNISTYDRVLKRNQEESEEINKRIESLRNSWYEANNKQFEYEQSDTCPTCGQKLPAEKVAEARERALNKFNYEKAGILESITTTGKELKENLDGLVNERKNTEKKLQESKVELQTKGTTAKNLAEEIEELKEKMNQYSTDSEYIKKLQEKQSVESTLKAVAEGQRGEIDKIQDEVVKLDVHVKAEESKLGDIRRYNQGKQRVDELKQQERTLAAEYEKMESELYLTEQFVRSKVALLEERINSHFNLARFKLFNTLVNGGVEECCETLYNGVPYSSGLNNAARINVGLDIINTLSEHYGFTAPIFIDNREAVTQLIETKGQVISLIVSEQDKKLRVALKYKPTKQDIEEAKRIVEKAKQELSSHSTYVEFPEEVKYLGEEYGEKHRWFIAKYEFYEYKGVKIQFSYDEPLTEMQEGQDTNPEIFILND